MDTDTIKLDTSKINSLTEDEKKARELLNICSNSNGHIYNNGSIDYILSLKAIHFIIAKKIVEEEKILESMSSFEWLIEAIEGIERVEEGDDIYF